MVIHLFRSTLKVRIVYNPPPFLPAANPIPFKHMPHCKLYVSGIVVHPSVSGLYHDSTTAAAAAAADLVPSQQTSKSCKLEQAPLWSRLTGARFFACTLINPVYLPPARRFALHGYHRS